MKIEDIKEFGVYYYNDDSGQTIFVEVLKVYSNERKAKVSLYKSSDIKETEIVFTENISPVLITESILKALSFNEISGPLYGLLNEHYFRLKMDNGIIEIIRDRGAMKFVQPSPNREDWYGCKFIPMPYLHQLQEMIGRIDIKSFINQLSKVNNTD